MNGMFLRLLKDRKMNYDVWRKHPITLEEWKENCANSSHVRDNDILQFDERYGVISCSIADTCIFIGAYFLNAVGNEIDANCGWNHY